jgi:tetratricopeptide (TPR) repeat protein
MITKRGPALIALSTLVSLILAYSVSAIEGESEFGKSLYARFEHGQSAQALAELASALPNAAASSAAMEELVAVGDRLLQGDKPQTAARVYEALKPSCSDPALVRELERRIVITGIKSGHIEEAKGAVEQWRAVEPSDEVLGGACDIADAYLDVFEPDEAADLFAFVRSNATSEKLKLKAEMGSIRVFEDKRQIGEVVDAVERLIAAYPESEEAPESIFELGKQLYEDKYPGSARIVWRKVAERYPESDWAIMADAHELNLVIAEDGRDAREAITDFLTAHSSAKSKAVRALKFSGEILVKHEHYDHAKAVFDSALENWGSAEPNNNYYKLLAGQAAAAGALGDFNARAAKLAELEGLASESDFLPACVYYANSTLVKTKRYPEAIAAQEEFLLRWPQHEMAPWAKSQLAAARFQLREFDQADELIDELIADPAASMENERILTKLSEDLFYPTVEVMVSDPTQESLKRAGRSIRRILEAFPSPERRKVNGDLRLLAGYCCWLTDDLDGGLDYANDMIRNWSDYKYPGYAYYLAGCCYLTKMARQRIDEREGLLKAAENYRAVIAREFRDLEIVARSRNELKSVEALLDAMNVRDGGVPR